MAARGAAALVLAAGFGLGGCVAQQSHDQLMDANRSLTERNSELQHKVTELENENGLLQKNRTANEAAIAEATRQNNALKAQLQAAGLSLKDLENRMAGLAFGPLDPATDQALSALAAQYPDIIKFDSNRGMLRFASDLTFASGSDTVQEGAKTGLTALAKILTSSAASQYEVMIMGHTDAQRISSATAGRGHPTNVHLSAHRAIAVRAVLASMGVPADKMFVAGWGEFRPVVANGPKGEASGNRRVEIYLTRASNSMSTETETTTTTTTPAPKATKTSANHESTPSRQPDLTK
jgi:chemotaxis protein MotB